MFKGLTYKCKGAEKKRILLKFRKTNEDRLRTIKCVTYVIDCL